MELIFGGAIGGVATGVASVGLCAETENRPSKHNIRGNVSVRSTVVPPYMHSYAKVCSNQTGWR